MFLNLDKVVLSMALLRFLSSSIEFTAAMLMLYFNRVDVAFKINAVLAMVGPTIFIGVTTLGLVGLAGKVSLLGMASIATGVFLIFLGINKL
ncbi:MAG: YqhV family protein [Desulfotomaculaceae bacterium]